MFPKFVLNIMKNTFYENMDILDKVIEKYGGLHRRSIVESDVQNIYHKVFNTIEDKIICNEEISREFDYNCKCLNTLIKVNIEFSNVEYTQCYGDINRIVLVLPIQCLDESDYIFFNERDTCLLGFGASLYCLLWDLVKDKSYELKRHKYKSFNDIFDENSLEDLHDLAVLILNTKYNENNFKTVCWDIDIPEHYPLPDFYSFL